MNRLENQEACSLGLLYLDLDCKIAVAAEPAEQEAANIAASPEAMLHALTS